MSDLPPLEILLEIAGRLDDNPDAGLIREAVRRLEAERFELTRKRRGFLHSDPEIRALTQFPIDVSEACREASNPVSVFYIEFEHGTRQRVLEMSRGPQESDTSLPRFLGLVEERLRGSILEARGDRLAYLNNTDFGVMIRDLPDHTAVKRKADELLETLDRIQLPGGAHLGRPRMGISLFPYDRSNPGELVSKAFHAAQRVDPHDGGYRFATLPPGQRKRREIARALRRVFTRRETNPHIAPFYQPIVDAREQKIIGAEALLNIDAVAFGDASAPLWEILSVAQSTPRLMRDLDLYVMQEACTKATQWGEQGPYVSVNVMPKSIGAHYVAEVLSTLRRTGLSPERFRLELVESGKLSDEQSALLLSLQRQGIKIVIDDYGTENSNATRIQDTDANVVKLDRRFVPTVEDPTEPQHTRDLALSQGLVSMLKGLRKDIVVEGIERPWQARLFESFECYVHQGFLYGRKMPAGEFRDLLAHPHRAFERIY